MTSELNDFLNFIVPIIKKEQKSKLYYYPEKSLKRIRNDQMSIFIDECIRFGLILKNQDGIFMTTDGKSAVQNNEFTKLNQPYKNALKKINKLYIDILI